MDLRESIERSFDGEEISSIRECIDEVLIRIETGELRVTRKKTGRWVTNEWVKKALILAFKYFPTELYEDGTTAYFDRIRPRFHGFTREDFESIGARVTPGAVVRSGASIGSNVVLMPSFVNIGAYVGEGTMIDTWATVGSCVQVGSGVHISGGVGLGGVLEPAQATPTIIEDGCFIGARSEVVEGVIVEENSVIGMGVFIGKSTPIYDRETEETHYGRVPSGSVVVSGVLNRGKYGLNAAIIVKTVDAQTRSKTSTTALLRGV
ncbi:MAG: 2,3,4,5-tetrahydropyridine-2,6-dicarboxylate N-succinyltransferase [bacterium]